MKKRLLSLLLCGLLVFGATACDTNGTAVDTTPAVTTTETTVPNENPYYPQVIKKETHYQIEAIGLGQFRYELYDLDGNVVLSREVLNKPLDISMHGDDLIDVCIGYGTGLAGHTYYSITKNSLSVEYEYVVANTETLVAFIDGANLTERRLIVKSIFSDVPDEELVYQTFYLDFDASMVMPIVSAKFLSADSLELIYYDGYTDGTKTVILTIEPNTEEAPTPSPKPDAPEPLPSGELSTYASIISYYRYAINHYDEEEPWEAVEDKLTFTNPWAEDVFWKIFDSGFTFYSGRGESDRALPYHKLHCGSARKDLNGDGIEELILLSDYFIVAVFSMSEDKPVLLGNYWARNSCWIDADGNLHINGSGGADHSTNAVYRIADGGASLELIAEFGSCGFYWEGDVAITKYYQVVDGERVSITKEACDALAEQYGKYLGCYESADATEALAGLTFYPMFLEDDIALETYEAVLQNEIKLYDTEWNEEKYLMDCKTPYLQTPLYNVTHQKIAFTDMDGDGINEVVIDCSDTLILRYYEGKVYLYSLIFRNCYSLCTDGTHTWDHTGTDFEYGEKQFYFDGTELKCRELYRVVNDGEPNAEYYVGDRQVTKEELLQYIADNPTTKVEFTPFAWEMVSKTEALAIAKDYWKDFEIEKNGYIVAIAYNRRAPESVYVAVIKQFVLDHYSTFDEIWIDKITGETIIPHWLDGKG